MPRVFWNEKLIKELPKDIQKRFLKQIKLFEQNPDYPSLNRQLYKGASSSKGIVWEIRINSKYRALLLQLWDENKEPTDDFEVIAVDKHDIIDKWKKTRAKFK